MRDEDLAKLPQTIERWKVAELLAGLGIEDFTKVQKVQLDLTAAHVQVLATGKDGRVYTVQVADEDGKTGPQLAVHQISIPFAGGWERPAEATQPCGSSCPEGDETCELPEGHYFCRSGGTSWPYQKRAVGGTAGVLCGSWRHEQMGDAKYRMACNKFEGHDGEHHFGRNTGRVTDDAPQA